MVYSLIMKYLPELLLFYGVLLYSPKALSSPHSPAIEGLNLFDQFRERVHAQYAGILKIDLLEAGTSTLKVKWALLNLSSADSVFESTAICETPNGKIVSDKLILNTDRFQFHHLETDSNYVVCVHLLEKSASSNTSILHYTCANFRTIPLIRADSIVGVILAVGYLVSMVALGYISWWRKSRGIKRRREEETMNINDKNKGTVNNYGTDREQENLNRTTASCCTIQCVKFPKKDGDLFQYNADDREITF